MGLRGPAGKPLELKVLEGNRGHRPLNLDATFRPEVGMPPIPKGLPPDARKVWKRLGAELLRYNLMSVVYSDAFGDLCDTIATVNLLKRSIRARQALLVARGEDPSEAFEIRTPNGMPVQHPVYQTLKSERNHMLALLAKFGADPSSQARVTTAVRAQLKLFEGDAAAAHQPAQPGGASAPAPGQLPTGFADF